MNFYFLIGLIWAQSQDLQVVTPKTPPGAGVTVKSSGVPAFSFVDKKKGLRSQSIPVLNIGSEAGLKFQEIKVDLPEAKKLDLSPYKKLITPPIKTGPTQVAPVKGFLVHAKVNPGFQVPNLPEVKEVQDPPVQQPNPQPLEIKNLSQGEVKLLQSLIFLEIHKNFGLAFGLLAEVISAEKELRTEAAYHLGLAALGLGLYSEFKHQLNKVLKEKSKDWQDRAIRSLALGTAPGDLDMVRNLDPKIYNGDNQEVSIGEADQYQINRAQFYLEKNNIQTALAALDSIGKMSSLSAEANFLKSIVLYRSGNLKESLQTQKEALDVVLKSKPDSELKSTIALTYARQLFQSGNYKDAFQTYLMVNNKNPEWPQAMIEQAWAQILTNDPEGAAGNMFTLHTDFLKHRFAPESYVVRTVGYLNLCQYGDGMKVLYEFKKRYEPIAAQMQAFAKENHNDLFFYNTLRDVYQKQTEKIVNGLPRTLIVDLARHPIFMAEQSQINSIEDQITAINGLTVSLIQTERNIIQKQSELTGAMSELRKQQKKNEYETTLNEMERKMAGLKMQQAIAKRGRDSIKDLRTQSLARMDGEKANLKIRAGKALKQRFQLMQSTLAKTLDQSELLAYEIFSGAGEHLRFQLAGGESKEKAQLDVKAGQGKSVKWEFKGELWEDELGHYRSSLKNVCSADDRYQK